MKPIDADFLEFWGNLLLNAAKSQRASQALADNMQHGFKAMSEFSELFQKAYGIDPSTEKRAAEADNSNGLQQAMQRYHKAFATFIQMLDVVPRSTHKALEERYDRLQKEMMQCQATVVRLESQLKKCRSEEDQAAFSTEFGELMEKQTRQFAQLVDSFGEAVKAPKK
jgi:hypothetical protein